MANLESNRRDLRDYWNFLFGMAAVSLMGCFLLMIALSAFESRTEIHSASLHFLVFRSFVPTMAVLMLLAFAALPIVAALDAGAVGLGLNRLLVALGLIAGGGLLGSYFAHALFFMLSLLAMLVFLGTLVAWPRGCSRFREMASTVSAESLDPVLRRVLTQQHPAPPG